MHAQTLHYTIGTLDVLKAGDACADIGQLHYTIGTLDVLKACDACADITLHYRYTGRAEGR